MIGAGFGIRVMVTSQNGFGSLPTSAIFWKNLSRIRVSFSLNFWQNSAVKPSGHGLLFVGRFLITVLIFVLVTSLLRFSFFPGSVLESYTFLRICPFLPSCPFYFHIVADKYLMILCISVLSVVISPFSFLILLI